jgi:hypothetical protein
MGADGLPHSPTAGNACARTQKPGKNMHVHVVQAGGGEEDPKKNMRFIDALPVLGIKCGYLDYANKYLQNSESDDVMTNVTPHPSPIASQCLPFSW